MAVSQTIAHLVQQGINRVTLQGLFVAFRTSRQLHRQLSGGVHPRLQAQRCNALRQALLGLRFVVVPFLAFVTLHWAEKLCAQGGTASGRGVEVGILPPQQQIGAQGVEKRSLEIAGRLRMHAAAQGHQQGQQRQGTFFRMAHHRLASVAPPSSHAMGYLQRPPGS